ncbi:UPF0481 protein, partial [Mucuna pruriens]
MVDVLAQQEQKKKKKKKEIFMGSVDQYHIQHIINIPEEIEPALWPECCIYKVPTSLLKVKEVAYTPLLISIGPVHHNKEELKEMQEQKHRYFHFFWVRIENKLDLVHYKAFLEQEEQKLRRCYQKKFSDISKEQFVEMMLLDAVFIMELFLREAKRWEYKDDYVITQGCVSKSIQCDLMLLENQLPIIVLEKLYDIVPSNVKKHTRFINLAYEYFRSYYPHQQSSENKFELSKWEKSLHFTDLIRNSYLPKNLSSQKSYSQKEYVLRTATKLNEAGISFEKVHNRSLLDIKFEKKRFFSWFLCLGCLPGCKLFKARFQIPQLKVDHTTECVLRNLIAFEQCHYPKEPYICNYVFLIDSLIHTKDDAELLVEKEAIVHELGSDQDLANLVNGLCKYVVTNSTCYHQIMEEVNEHYNNNWKWAMGTLRWVYFRDPWRSSSTIVGIAVLIFTIFNFYRDDTALKYPKQHFTLTISLEPKAASSCIGPSLFPSLPQPWHSNRSREMVTPTPVQNSSEDESKLLLSADMQRAPQDIHVCPLQMKCMRMHRPPCLLPFQQHIDQDHTYQEHPFQPKHHDLLCPHAFPSNSSAPPAQLKGTGCYTADMPRSKWSKLLACVVTALVSWDWQVWEENTDWKHPIIKVMEQCRDIVEELVTNFTPQETSTGCQDDQMLQFILQINLTTWSPL